MSQKSSPKNFLEKLRNLQFSWLLPNHIPTCVPILVQLDEYLYGLYPVASGWVTPAGRQLRVSHSISSKKPATFFAHHYHYHYHFLLLSLGCPPLGGVTQGGPPSDAIDCITYTSQTSQILTI